MEIDNKFGKQFGCIYIIIIISLLIRYWRLINDYQFENAWLILFFSLDINSQSLSLKKYYNLEKSIGNFE